MNKLNVFNNCYLPIRYPSNWIKNINTFFRSFKYAYQRATNGYCDLDIWNLSDYYLAVFEYTLNRLSDITRSYCWYFDNAEEWESYLRDMANCFHNADFENYYFDHEQCGISWIEDYETVDYLARRNLANGIEMMYKCFYNLGD